MKKFFYLPLSMLCIAMAVIFAACEPEPETIDGNEKALAFLCDGQTIATGSTFTTSFAPEIDLFGDADGEVSVTVQSLNQSVISICGFGNCQLTSAAWGYATTASGNIVANTSLPLEIHYEPTSPSAPQCAEALITAYYKGEEDNAVSFTLVMVNE